MEDVVGLIERNTVRAVELDVVRSGQIQGATQCHLTRARGLYNAQRLRTRSSRVTDLECCWAEVASNLPRIGAVCCKIGSALEPNVVGLRDV